MGFADAGHASKTPDTEMRHDATRSYKSGGQGDHSTKCGNPNCTLPSCMIEGGRRGQGRLADDVRFSRWLYSWENHDFLVYEVSYPDSYNRPIRRLYVAAPAGENVKGRYHEHTDALLLAAGAWTKELHDEIYVFDDAQWEKSAAMFKSIQGNSWDDVILPATLKENLVKDVVSFFDSRDLYASMRVPWKRGVILHGVPGNGKTVSIKALINSLSKHDPPVPALVVKSFDNCSGPKWAMKAMFAHARAMAPCLLIFEDLDSLIGPKTRSYFLNEVDGLESNDGILMIGSTNNLDKLDSSITKRPSRFDRKYHFKVPEESERVAYCRYWASKFADKSTVDFPDEVSQVVAKMTEGFTFAYLKELFISSLLIVARNRQAEVEEAEDENENEHGDGDSTSSSNPVVVEAPADSGDEKGTQTAEPSTKDAKVVENPTKPKRVMPEVEIPEHLQGNELLKVLLKEAKLLWDQMDSSEEEAKKESSKKKREEEDEEDSDAEE